MHLTANTPDEPTIHFTLERTATGYVIIRANGVLVASICPDNATLLLPRLMPSGRAVACVATDDTHHWKAVTL